MSTDQLLTQGLQTICVGDPGPAQPQLVLVLNSDKGDNSEVSQQQSPLSSQEEKNTEETLLTVPTLADLMKEIALFLPCGCKCSEQQKDECVEHSNMSGNVSHSVIQ